MMRHKRKITPGKVFIFGGLLLIAAALLLTAYNLWDEQRAAENAETAVTALKSDARTWYAEDGKFSPTYPNYVLDPAIDMPTVEIDGEEYIGILTIPALDLELPIISEWSYPRMKIAPCRYKGSVYLDNLILCGHNYDRHFGRLKYLNPGDEVLFTDVENNEFRYTVSLVETLGGTAVEEMEAGDWKLTLFTCTIGGQTRVTVRCE